MSVNTVISYDSGEVANEFYIVLSGDVGIFIPRTLEDINKEYKALTALRAMVKQAQLGPEITSEILSANIDLSAFPAEEKKFISKLAKFTETEVYYKYSYLEQKLGNLPSKMLENELFFNSVTSV